MHKATRKLRFLLPVFLTGVLLRAFIPAGYMPTAPGKGLLFELCHDGLPVSFMAALDEHAHHGDHGTHDDHGAVGDCSFGHIVAFTFIDAPAAPEIQVPPADTMSAVEVADGYVAQRVYARAPRGPPSRKQ